MNLNESKRRSSDIPPAYTEDEAAETRAIAYLSTMKLAGTDQWSFLSKAILLLSFTISFGYLYFTDELASERKGFLSMGILSSSWCAVTLSKRIRDEQHGDLLVKYAQHTRMYHPSNISNLRGTDSFRIATRVAVFVFFVALYGGLWYMPLPNGTKWMIAMICTFTISSTFIYAQANRNQDDAASYLRQLNGNAEVN
jgi:hypothetical protein